MILIFQTKYYYRITWIAHTHKESDGPYICKSILDNFPAGPEKTPKGPSLFPTVFYPAVQLLMLKFIGVQATAERVVVAV